MRARGAAPVAWPAATRRDAAAPPARCAGCGRSFEARDWPGLDLVERITGERLRALVTRWPSGTTIEVRRCACGLVVARLTTT